MPGIVFALAAVALFLSGVILSFLQPFLMKYFLPRLSIGDGMAALNLLSGFSLSAHLLGLAASYAFSHLRPWSSQILPFLICWLGAGLVIVVAPGAGVPLFLMLLPFGVIIVLCVASMVLIPYWLGVALRAEPGAWSEIAFLYALYFAGHFGATLAYPSLIEPEFDLLTQRRMLVGLFCALGFATMAIPRKVWLVAQSAAQASEVQPASGLMNVPPTWYQRVRWTLLALMPAGVLRATVTYISTDISPIPLLLPCVAGLWYFSFVRSFGRNTFARRRTLAATVLLQAACVLTLGAIWVAGARLFDASVAETWGLTAGAVALIFAPHRLTMVLQPVLAAGGLVYWFRAESVTDGVAPVVLVLLHLALFWSASWGCHGDLLRRPVPPTALRDVILCITLGDLLAGLCTQVAAPFLFQRTIEFPLFVVLACLVRLLPAGPRDTTAGEGRCT